MAYFSQVNTVNSSGSAINPATDEQIILLRRIVKLLESTAASDIGQRQRVTIDAITSGLTLTTLTGITNALPAGTNTMGNVTVGGMDHKQFIDVARNAYANGIRSKLTFS